MFHQTVSINALQHNMCDSDPIEITPGNVKKKKIKCKNDS